MKKLLYFSFVIINLLVFQSCDEDSFSQVVEIDIPEHEPKLTINGSFMDEDGFITLTASHSKGILDNREYTIFENAEARLYKNDVLAATLEYKQEFIGYTGTFNSTLETDNDSYRIELEVEGYDPVYAEQIMPLPVEIVNASYEIDGAISPDGERVNALKLEIKDPVGIKNHYSVRAFYQSGNNSGGIYLETIDPLVSEGWNEEILINDKSFDGKSYEFPFYTYSDIDISDPDTKIQVVVFSITKDLYLYEKSLAAYYNNEGNPFAEPVIVHNNITNGYGIFGVKSVSRFDIEE